MRFNPPPNWPPAPPDWTPTPDWQPDPAWGPPPPGWPLWVAAAPRRSRTRWWLMLAAITAVVVVAVGLVWVVGSGAEQHTAKPSAKPDITTLSADLLVDQAAFPDLGEDATWTDWEKSADDDTFGPPDGVTVDPPDCADLVDVPRSATASAGVKLSDFSTAHLRSTAAQLSVGPDQVPLADYVGECGKFTIAKQTEGTATKLSATVRPLRVSGLPSWAVAYTIGVSEPASAATADAADAADDGMAMKIVAGYYRGVLVDVVYADNVYTSGDSADPEDIGDTDPTGTVRADDLLELFTAQVTKLEAAS